MFTLWRKVNLIDRQVETDSEISSRTSQNSVLTSDLLNGRDLFFYVKQPVVGNPNYDKNVGTKLYLLNGGSAGRDDGLQRLLAFHPNVRNLSMKRGLRFSPVRTNVPDPTNPLLKLFKIEVWMDDYFKGNRIVGVLVANSAGPVVDDPSKEAKGPELDKLRYYWKFGIQGDGFSLINFWQTERRIGWTFENNSFRTLWSNPEIDVADKHILPFYYEN